MKLFKNKFFSFGLFAVLVGSIVFLGSIYFSESEMYITKVEGDPIADFTDKRNLVGATDHVFIGVPPTK